MNRQTKLWAGYILGNAGLLMIYLLPQMVGVVTEQFGLSPMQSGFFASTDLMGSAIASISSFFWIRKTNWKTMAWLGLGIVIVGNLLSMVAGSFGLLAFMRIFTGLGQGIAVALTLVIVGDSENTDRNFAIYLILTLLFGAAAVELLPALYSPFEGVHIYGAQIATCLLAIPFILKWLPERGKLSEEVISDNSLSMVSILCLFGVLVLYMGYGGLWALTERIGVANGFAPDFIANVLSISLLVSIPALLVPIVFGVKFGRALPITIASIGLILYSVLIYYGQNSTLFFLAVAAGSFGVNMIIPYMTGILADEDKTGKGVVMVMPMYAIGFALGPSVLSIFTTGDGFLPITIAATLMFILVFIIYFWVILKNKNGE